MAFCQKHRPNAGHQKKWLYTRLPKLRVKIIGYQMYRKGRKIWCQKIKIWENFLYFRKLAWRIWQFYFFQFWWPIVELFNNYIQFFSPLLESSILILLMNFIIGSDFTWRWSIIFLVNFISLSLQALIPLISKITLDLWILFFVDPILKK